MHASALGRRVQAAYGLLSRRPRFLVLAQALGLVLGRDGHALTGFVLPTAGQNVPPGKMYRRAKLTAGLPYTLPPGTILQKYFSITQRASSW
jgi:hypothetical protein